MSRQFVNHAGERRGLRDSDAVEHANDDAKNTKTGGSCKNHRSRMPEDPEAVQRLENWKRLRAPG
jgi:hypothetical protein